MDQKTTGETSFAFLRRMRLKRSIEDPIPMVLHQGEVLAVTGPGCAGKTEFALKVAASACIAAAEAQEASQSQEKPTPAVFYIQIGDMFPIQRFVHLLETAYTRAYAQRDFAARPQESPEQEERRFMAWMERVTSRCEVIECLDATDAERVLSDLSKTDLFPADTTSVPVCILDCGMAWSQKPVAPAQSPPAKRKEQKSEAQYAFNKILQHSFPELINARNGCGIALYRAPYVRADAGESANSENAQQSFVSLDGVGTVHWSCRVANAQVRSPGRWHEAKSEQMLEMRAHFAVYSIDKDDGFTVHN